MRIQLDNAGKRYNRDWIFRNFSYHFTLGDHYAITGPNGSGKSTLLQILAGAISLNEGLCKHYFKDKIVESEKVYSYTSVCAPYMELIEELTLVEFFQFHQSFKPLINQASVDFISSEIQLYDARNKKIGEYSSGMKQRAKLAQCIFSDTPLVLLDEPCTNLDEAGASLYRLLIDKYCRDRLVIVSSNDKREYEFCNEILDITNYKTNITV